MSSSVEKLCNQVARCNLLDVEAVRALRERWRTEARDVDDTGQFSKWLVKNKVLTEFQAGMLARGFADLLILNQYKLIERIGQGRMAGVYKASHQLGQIVAIKVLPPSKAEQPQLLSRFLREARLAARLKHPHVVRTFQRGVTKGNLHFIVMEYLDGETLEEIGQRRGKLPCAEAIRILTQTLAGLQYLHEEGLIHRDLKPANLMLVPGAAPGQDTTLHAQVKILDIGLGRALFDEGAPAAGEQGDLTSEGTLLGTPNYMAPEQARSAHSADIRSDIYSLGCVFYYMLTGQPPFPDTSFVRQMVRHATEPPRRLRELVGAVPEGLQDIVDCLLAKDPAQRFPTPAQAARALQRYLDQVSDPSGPTLSDARMESYLTWLDKNPGEDTETIPVDSLAPAALSRTVPVAPPPAKRAGITPMPRPTAPVLPGIAAAAVPQRPAAVPKAPPAMPGKLPDAAAPVQAVTATPVRPARLLRVTPRDLLFVGIGVGSILLLEGIFWLLARLLG
jgi:serine/threonine protein kinase